VRIAFLGVKGSGKGTYASRLSPILKIPHISTGDIFREIIAKETPLGKKVKEIVNKGKFVSDDIVLEILKERLKNSDCKNGFILDGVPRTVEQAKGLEKLEKLDIVICLDVPEDIIVKRISSRITCKKCGEIYNLLNMKPEREGICDKCGGKLYQRKDDTPESARQRLKEDEENLKPLIDYYKEKGILRIVSCNEFNSPPEDTVNKILEILGDLK